MTDAIDNSHLAPEVQTDKAKTKTVPCQICSRPLVVNVFYAPAKARCSEHTGQPAHGIRKMVTRAPSSFSAQPLPEVAPNHALADLRCPFCSESLIIKQIDDKLGFVTFGCRNDQTAIVIKPRWQALVARDVPERFRALVEEFNIRGNEERLRRLDVEGKDSRGVPLPAQSVAVTEAKEEAKTKKRKVAKV